MNGTFTDPLGGTGTFTGTYTINRAAKAGGDHVRQRPRQRWLRVPLAAHQLVEGIEVALGDVTEKVSHGA